ncbi:MAG TPA: hypothetical protein PLS03_08925 [Terrimicrobiaceae bacterium]|nr:hypothetical protein [Terrimicrobiaceae bacterium]
MTRSVLRSTAFILMLTAACANAAGPVSHPPRRLPVFAKDRPLVPTAAYFVDPAKGDDSGPGSIDLPWRTIQTSLTKLTAGDTLYLRGGIYFENVTCSMTGEAGRPITICGYPGETAIIDGSLPEFQTDPVNAWQEGEAPGEFVSRRAYPNIRDVLGLFADSHIGLQTYWYREDMIAPGEQKAGKDESPLHVFFYCGPGLFYNKKTGRIHVRLAQTNNNRPVMDDYRGPDDPRKLPLVVAPYRSVVLHLDQAMHVRLQDLVLRGGGFNTVLMHFAVDITFDHVTVFGGSYSIRSKGSGPVKMTNCGIYGQIPPWSYQSENNLQTYDPKHYSPFTSNAESKARNISRLPSHALLVTEGGEESDIFYYPLNNTWEISHCEFADSHDGVYLNGRDMWMHHCWLDNIQDDATYLSSPAPGVCDDVHLSRNYISECITAFGAHNRGGPQGRTYVYGNVVDMRHFMPTDRPSKDNPEGRIIQGASLYTPHGGAGGSVENLTFAYNTVLIPNIPASYAGRTYLLLTPETQRVSCNSIYVYLGGPGGTPDSRPPAGPILIDGNLHWSPGLDETKGMEWLQTIRDSIKSRETVSRFSGLPWDGRGAYGDPRFVAFAADGNAALDLRLAPGSPAAGLAVELPNANALRDFTAGKAVGAYQAGDPHLQVGIDGRIRAGVRPPIPVQP